MATQADNRKGKSSTDGRKVYCSGAMQATAAGTGRYPRHVHLETIAQHAARKGNGFAWCTAGQRWPARVQWPARR